MTMNNIDACMHYEALKERITKVAESLAAAIPVTARPQAAQEAAVQFGVSKDFVMPSIIKDFARQIETIETILLRAESSLAVMLTA